MMVTLPSPKHVVIACELLDLLRVHEGRLVLAGHGPVVLGPLDQHGRGREQPDVADVIAVGVGDRHVGDVGRLDAELGELGGQRLGPALDDGAVGRHQAVRHGGHGIADAGVPQQQALAVPDQVAVVGELDRLALIDAGRPA
jgi:hypothetical protein